MVIFLVLGYLTKDDIFWFYPSTFKFHKVILAAYQYSIPYILYPFFWRASRIFPKSRYDKYSCYKQSACVVGWEPLGHIPKSVIRGLEVDQLPIFWETAMLVSIVSAQLCTLTRNGEVFLLLHIITCKDNLVVYSVKVVFSYLCVDFHVSKEMNTVWTLPLLFLKLHFSQYSVNFFYSSLSD